LRPIKTKILVVCPGGAISGGPELLHQLVHELREAQADAAICYVPLWRDFEIPTPYHAYNVEQRAWSDEKDQIIVIPESLTKYLRIIKHSTPYVWWLSVDNYLFLPKYPGIINGIYRVYECIFGQKSAMDSMLHIRHLAQSKYALNFLAKHDIVGDILTDYLSSEHLNKNLNHRERKNIVAYNPAKGMAIHDLIIRSNPDINFVPIQNMNRSEVSELLASAKVYMDFGNHPGKDRIPREAAIAGCCVVTGKRGSAAFAEDVPIIEKYKLCDTSPELQNLFRSLVTSIFADFEDHQKDFATYRNAIKAEPGHFRRQVHQIFGN
jgi:hypothetical protein